MQRVLLVPHDPCWAEKYASDAVMIANKLGALLVAIHHIGSTAILGICAKPIIDMLVVVSDLALLDANSSELEVLGYEAMGEFGIVGRRYFRKDDRNGTRTHQIHAFQSGSSQVERHVAFCEFMKTHSNYAKEYDALKRRLAELHPTDISSYTAGKDEFIKQMDAKAAAWRSANAHDGLD